MSINEIIHHNEKSLNGSDQNHQELLIMNSKTESKELLSPLQLGDLNLWNRVVLAPLTRARAGAERINN